VRAEASFKETKGEVGEVGMLFNVFWLWMGAKEFDCVKEREPKPGLGDFRGFLSILIPFWVSFEGNFVLLFENWAFIRTYLVHIFSCFEWN
jgi:hypothetical protein